jgi:hypothetical protein
MQASSVRPLRLSAEEAHAEAPGPTARERDLLAGGALAGAGIQLETFPLAEVATTAVAMENAIGTEPALGEAARAEE